MAGSKSKEAGGLFLVFVCVLIGVSLKKKRVSPLQCSSSSRVGDAVAALARALLAF